MASDGGHNQEALAGALRALGMGYGSGPSLADIGSGDAAEAIRAYIRRERPHLLTCYDLETLVELVLSARDAGSDAGPGIEATVWNGRAR